MPFGGYSYLGFYPQGAGARWSRFGGLTDLSCIDCIESGLLVGVGYPRLPALVGLEVPVKVREPYVPGWGHVLGLLGP